MVDTIVNVGFIGAGSLANAMHYPSLHEMKEVHIAAICDLNEERLTATADKYGVASRFRNYREMLEQVDLDAVYIIMPPHHLFDLVIDCLNAGKHVFIEKPPGVTAEQTRQMARCAQRNGVKTMCAFNRRFIPMLVQAKQRVEQYGPILQAVSTFYKHHLQEKGAGPYYGGAIDILSCDAVHAVDLLRWMGGGEVIRVASAVKSLYADYTNFHLALVEFDTGCTGVLLTNWVGGTRVHTFEMHAKGISAFLNPNDKGYLYADGQEVPEVWDTREVAGSAETFKYYGFFGENRHFIDCILHDREPETNFFDAAKTMELVQAIYHHSW